MPSFYPATTKLSDLNDSCEYIWADNTNRGQRSFDNPNGSKVPLVNGDRCLIGDENTGTDLYWFNASSGAEHDGDLVIQPKYADSGKAYAGDGRWLKVPKEEGGTETYTGIAERTVGGITDEDEFVDATMTEMWDQLIKEEKFPALTAPSSTFDSDYEGYRELGEVIATITFSAAFDRGSINPQYTADSEFRSGLPNQYTYTGAQLSNEASTDLTDEQTATNYTVIANGQSWTCRVEYDEGAQPKSSYDNDYSTPLAAGNTSVDTETITGVLPVYGTTSDITTMTKQSLAGNGSTIDIDLVAEEGSDKQTVDFPDDAALSWGAITCIRFFNTISQTWDWIGGSEAASLATFTETSTTQTVQSISRDYARFTHNGVLTGSRNTRWYTS